MKSDIHKKEEFQSKLGFVLACIGSAVGMGNIWRFPILVSEYGGLCFLIPYFIFVFLVASTGVIGEMAFGRYTGGGPIKAFSKACDYRYGKPSTGAMIGFIPVIGSLALAIGYSCVIGWIFKYTFLAFTGGLSSMGQDMDNIGGLFASTARSFGNNHWIIIALIVTFLISALGVAKGIEKANKIMMPILFMLLVCLCIYIMTLPGAGNGLKYIFTLDVNGLMDPRVWIYAFGQAFFSLSVAGSGTLIYGSYLSKDEDIISSARDVAFFDTVAAILAALVIIPAMASGNAELNTGGPGLMFIYLVRVMNNMPGGEIVEIVFFVSVLFAGLSSLINLYEAPIASLQQQFGLKRSLSSVIIMIIGISVSMFIQGIVGEWMDFVSIYICPLGALLAGIMFFWVFGKEVVLKSINTTDGKIAGEGFYKMSKYIYCFAALIALVAGALLGGIG